MAVMKSSNGHLLLVVRREKCYLILGGRDRSCYNISESNLITSIKIQSKHTHTLNYIYIVLAIPILEPISQKEAQQSTGIHVQDDFKATL